MADISVTVTGVTATGRTDGLPLFQTNTGGDIRFTTSASSTLVEVENASHGCVSGDFVTFSNVTFGGASPSLVTQLENNLEITVTGTNTFTVNVASATGTDLRLVGAADADFMLNKGSVTQLLGTGWGAGALGRRWMGRCSK